MVMFVPLQVIMTLPHGSGPQEKVGKRVLEVETSKQKRKVLHSGYPVEHFHPIPIYNNDTEMYVLYHFYLTPFVRDSDIP